MTTLTLPSGEEAYDEPSTILSSNPRVSRVETGEGLIHFYINEVNNKLVETDERFIIFAL